MAPQRRLGRRRVLVPVLWEVSYISLSDAAQSLPSLRTPNLNNEQPTPHGMGTEGRLLPFGLRHVATESCPRV